MKKPLYALCAAALIFGCTPEPDPNFTIDPVDCGEELNEAYVYFTEEAAAKIENGSLSATKAGIGVESCERIIPDGGDLDKRHRAAGLHRWYTVRYSKLVGETKAAEGLGSLEGVVGVSFPQEITPCSTSYFNDTGMYLQWSLQNDGTLPSSLGDGSYVAGCDINVIPVWKNYTTGSKNVIVSVIDGAADPDNKEFKDVVIAPGEHGSRSFIDGYEGDVLYPYDHGCNVAGIIAAASNNSYGMAGIAGGSDGTGGVKVLSCGIFMTNPADPKRSTLSTSSANILKAFVHSADEGAVICNCSWGITVSDEEQAARRAADFPTSESPVRTGIDYFVANAGTDGDGNQNGPMKGGLVVFAADNTGFQHACPAEYEKVMAVAAHGPAYDFASYSAYGDWVDLIAPGGDNLGDEKSPYRMIFGPLEDNNFGYMAGTSQAAPHVSGVAALLVSYFGGQGFTAEKLWEYLVGGSRRGVIEGKMDGPMLDALGSFEYAAEPSKVRIEPSFTKDLTLRSHESTALSYSVLNNPEKLPVTVETACKAVSYTISSNSVKLTIEAPKEDPGTYPVAIYAGKGTSNETSVKFSLTILPNNAPQISQKMPDLSVGYDLSEEEMENCEIILSDYFTDPDGETLVYNVQTSDSGIIEFAWMDDIMVYCPKDYGTAAFTVQASDAKGEYASQTFSIVCRDTDRKFDIYPSPVHDFLYVRAYKECITVLELFNSAGIAVISQKSTTSPASPMQIDVSSLAPGTYKARVTVSGTQMDDVTIVKI